MLVPDSHRTVTRSVTGNGSIPTLRITRVSELAGACGTGRTIATQAAAGTRVGAAAGGAMAGTAAARISTTVVVPEPLRGERNGRRRNRYRISPSTKDRRRRTKLYDAPRKHLQISLADRLQQPDRSAQRRQVRSVTRSLLAFEVVGGDFMLFPGCRILQEPDNIRQFCGV